MKLTEPCWHADGVILMIRRQVYYSTYSPIILNMNNKKGVAPVLSARMKHFCRARLGLRACCSFDAYLCWGFICCKITFVALAKCKSSKGAVTWNKYQRFLKYLYIFNDSWGLPVEPDNFLLVNDGIHKKKEKKSLRIKILLPKVNSCETELYLANCSRGKLAKRAPGKDFKKCNIL